MLAVNLPEDIEARLDALARLTGRSKDFYAREAILAHLDDLEDYYLAEQRMDALQRAESDTVPLADVMKTYGLDG